MGAGAGWVGGHNVSAPGAGRLLDGRTRLASEPAKWALQSAWTCNRSDARSALWGISEEGWKTALRVRNDTH